MELKNLTEASNIHTEPEKPWNLDYYNPLPNFVLPRPISPLPATPKHNQTNNNEKSDEKYNCSLCLKKFSLKESINRHLRKSCMNNPMSVYCKKQRPYQCKECGNKFGLEKNLQQHIRNKHI